MGGHARNVSRVLRGSQVALAPTCTSPEIVAKTTEHRTVADFRRQKAPDMGDVDENDHTHGSYNLWNRSIHKLSNRGLRSSRPTTY